MFADVSMDRYASQIHEQFSNDFENEIVDDCIGNYMFLADHNPYDLNTVLSLSYKHHSEERVVVTNDQDMITIELEGHQSSNREAAIAERMFSMDQHVSYLCFKDRVAAFMESYIPENLKISYFLNLSTFPGEYDFLNEFLPLLLHFKHQLLISDKEKVSSILKLLEWLLWKPTFT